MDQHHGDAGDGWGDQDAGFDAGWEGDDRSPIDTAGLLFGAVAHALQRAGPETTEHLVKAGQELVLAVRAFVKHFAEAVTEGTEARQPLEQIPIAGMPAPARPGSVSLGEAGRGPDGDVGQPSEAEGPADD